MASVSRAVRFAVCLAAGPDEDLQVGKVYRVIPDPKADKDDPDHVPAPMPGKVSNVAVSKGQAVKEGERLLSIEAMKMETAVYSPRAAKVKDVLVNAGSTSGNPYWNG